MTVFVDEIPGIRARAYQRPPCEPTEHNWHEVQAQWLVLFVLCTTCGITPLEMLGSLKIDPKGYDPEAKL